MGGGGLINFLLLKKEGLIRKEDLVEDLRGSSKHTVLRQNTVRDKINCESVIIN